MNGVESRCSAIKEEFVALVPKSSIGKVEKQYDVCENVNAPIIEGQQLGTVKYRLANETLGEAKVMASGAVRELNFFDVFLRILAKMALK